MPDSVRMAFLAHVSRRGGEWRAGAGSPEEAEGRGGGERLRGGAEGRGGGERRRVGLGWTPGGCWARGGGREELQGSCLAEQLQRYGGLTPARRCACPSPQSDAKRDDRKAKDRYTV